MAASDPPKMSLPSAVHFVGSIPLLDTSTVLQSITEKLPGRIRRLRDGETGDRNYFVFCQDVVFLTSPFIMPEQELAKKKHELKAADSSDEIRLGETKYDDAALASYQIFRDLRSQGVIEPNTRFQVSLPTPVNVVPKFVLPQYHERVEPMYESFLIKALKNIQEQIPASDLAIQWDCAVEFAMLEEVGKPFTPWFSPVKEGIVNRLLKLSAQVKAGVELGFHLCYGDLNHRHFVQPKDTSLLVEMANQLAKQVQRPIQWVQLPVPKDRTDDSYFAPLKQLKLQPETELFIGLIHPYDLQGTLERIKRAQMVVQGFGVSTECGIGRCTEDELSSVLNIMGKVTEPTP
ncbi:MAG: hypothetical protein Q9191_002529 [Dirinaria sp. TL-2023a]